MKLKFVFKVWQSSKGVWREIQLQIFQISPHQTILKRLRIIVVLLLLMLSAKCPIWWSLFGTVRTLERRQKMLGICLVLCAFRFFFFIYRISTHSCSSVVYTFVPANLQNNEYRNKNDNDAYDKNICVILHRICLLSCLYDVITLLPIVI